MHTPGMGVEKVRGVLKLDPETVERGSHRGDSLRDVVRFGKGFATKTSHLIGDNHRHSVNSLGIEWFLNRMGVQFGGPICIGDCVVELVLRPVRVLRLQFPAESEVSWVWRRYVPKVETNESLRKYPVD